MAGVLYGTGLRLMECLRLRVKDVDFGYGQILVRDGKEEHGHPPACPNLCTATGFGKPMPEMVRAVLPAFGVLFVGVLLITYLPWLTSWLPGKF